MRKTLIPCRKHGISVLKSVPKNLDHDQDRNGAHLAADSPRDRQEMREPACERMQEKRPAAEAARRGKKEKKEGLGALRKGPGMTLTQADERDGAGSPPMTSASGAGLSGGGPSPA